MGASTSRGQVEDVGRALAVDPIASILQRYSDALIPEARCRAARLCLEGSKSRNRLSEVPAWPVLFFAASHGLEQLALDTPSGRHNQFSLGVRHASSQLPCLRS